MYAFIIKEYIFHSLLIKTLILNIESIQFIRLIIEFDEI